MTIKTFNILLQLDSHHGTNSITQTKTHNNATLTAHKLTTHVPSGTLHRLYNTKKYYN